MVKDLRHGHRTAAGISVFVGGYHRHHQVIRFSLSPVAGDIGSATLSDEIAAFKPLRAVYGNIDDAQTRRIWPETACFACEEITVLMTHIGGYPGRYEPSFLRRIESCRPGIVITGHSHILKVMYDRRHGALHINPGAAGKYGFHKVRTAIRLEVDGSAIGSLEVGEWKK